MKQKPAMFFVLMTLLAGLTALSEQPTEEQTELLRQRILEMREFADAMEAHLPDEPPPPPPPPPGELLQPEDFTHLGSFRPPAPQGSSSWDYGLNAATLTYVPDCLGIVDPTPGDGYPGCLLGGGHDHHNLVALMDIPAPGARAVQLTDWWDVTQGRKDLTGAGLGRLQALYYDRGERGCRVWWSWSDTYVDIAGDLPFLGWSECEVGGAAYGPLDVGEEWDGDVQDDPLHTAKLHTAIRRAPAGWPIGPLLLFGSRRPGSRGGSAGPSLAQLTDPWPEPISPLSGESLHYWPCHHDLGAPCWAWYRTGPEGEGFGDAGSAYDHYEPLDEGGGMEAIQLADGRRGLVVTWRKALPTPGSSRELAEVWYGLPTCAEPGHVQNPSYREFSLDCPERRDCPRAPEDCAMGYDPLCPGGTGPHAVYLEPQLLLYDPATLALGERQPYGVVEADWYETTLPCLVEWGGTAWDPERSLLYVAQSERSPRIHALRIEG